MGHSLLEDQIFQLEKRLMSGDYMDLEALLAEDF